MKDNNPISPHIQVYNWHISSLVSISHRITGVINYLLLILVCFWVISLIFGSESYQYFKKFSSLGFAENVFNSLSHNRWIF